MEVAYHLLDEQVVPVESAKLPAARYLLARLELSGRLVSMDALHPQTQKAREEVLEHGADYLFTLKGNQPGVRSAAAAKIPLFAPTSPAPST